MHRMPPRALKLPLGIAHLLRRTTRLLLLRLHLRRNARASSAASP
jgi:hypothetical protein